MKILTIRITDRRRIFELAAVAITAGGKFLFMDFLKWRLPFILCTLVAWSVYAYVRSKSHSTKLQYWGFRNDNFKKVLRMLLPFALIAIVTCVVMAMSAVHLISRGISFQSLSCILFGERYSNSFVLDLSLAICRI